MSPPSLAKKEWPVPGGLLRPCFEARPSGQARHVKTAIRAARTVTLSTSVVSMEGEAWARPAAAVQTCCCLTARCGWVVQPRAPLLGWRAHRGLLGKPSHCQLSRPVRSQPAPVAAAASAATGARRATRAASAQSTSTRQRPKDDDGDSVEEAELVEVDEEEGQGEGDRHAAEAGLRASQQRGAARSRPSGEAGPSAEVKMPWLERQWLESLHAQQAELDRLQAATKLGTVAEDVRTCWAVVVVTPQYTSEGGVLRVCRRASLVSWRRRLALRLHVCCSCWLISLGKQAEGALVAPGIPTFSHADVQQCWVQRWCAALTISAYGCRQPSIGCRRSA